MPNLRRLKKLIKSFNLQAVAICEPKVNVSKFDATHMKLGIDAGFF